MMTDLPPAIGTLVLFLALPAGWALSAGMIPAWSRVARAGTATLAGLGAITALAHALMTLGVPARFSVPVLTGLGVAGGAVFFARARRNRPRPSQTIESRLRARDRSLALAAARELAPIALIVVLLWVPFREAQMFAVSEHDAVYIWAPKAARALAEAPPELEVGAGHAHSEYPRGLGILMGAVGATIGQLDPTLPRLVPLFLFALTLLCVFDALAARANLAGAFAAVVILGSIPHVLHHATSGYSDVPLAGFILLGAVGLTSGRGGLPVPGIALAGGLGALVMKDEGMAFCAALVLVLAIRLARSRDWRMAGASVVIAALVAAPWVVLRMTVRVPGAVSWRSMSQNAGLMLIRFDRLVREIGHFALGLPDPSPGGITLPDAVPGADLVNQIALVAALVLLIGRGGSFCVLPLGLLFIADFAAILVSPLAVDWHLATALNRLVIQGLPLLIVAAIDKLTTPAPITLLGLEPRIAGPEPAVLPITPQGR